MTTPTPRKLRPEVEHALDGAEELLEAVFAPDSRLSYAYLDRVTLALVELGVRLGLEAGARRLIDERMDYAEAYAEEVRRVDPRCVLEVPGDE